MTNGENEKVARGISSLKSNEVVIDYGKYLDSKGTSDRPAISILYQLEAGRRITDAVERFDKSSSRLAKAMIALTLFIIALMLYQISSQWP